MITMRQLSSSYGRSFISRAYNQYARQQATNSKSLVNLSLIKKEIGVPTSVTTHSEKQMKNSLDHKPMDGFLYNAENKLPPPKAIAILLFNGIHPIDYLGPLSIFDSWNEQSASGPKAFTLSENGEVKCDYGRAYKTDYKGSEHPDFDSILVPGGRGRKNIENIAWAVNFLRNNEQQCSHILSVCTGVFLLKDAGLIDGKDVTTHHFALKELEDYGNATVKKDLDFVSSDRVWSSAGVYCGSKMALAFIKSFEGYQNSEGNTLDGDYQKVLNAVQHDEVF